MTREDRIAEILGDWYARQEQGEDLDAGGVIRAHPDLEEELRERFAALDVIDRAFSEVRAQSEGMPRQIGEYRLLREVLILQQPRGQIDAENFAHIPAGQFGYPLTREKLIRIRHTGSTLSCRS